MTRIQQRLVVSAVVRELTTDKEEEARRERRRLLENLGLPIDTPVGECRALIEQGHQVVRLDPQVTR